MPHEPVPKEAALPQKMAPAAESFADAQPQYGWVRMSRVLVVTWFAYAAYIIARKPFVIVRVPVENELGISTFMSGMVDTSFLFTYCFGQIFYSQLKSRYSSKFIISLGLFGAAGCTALFAMTSSPYVMVFLWGLNGVFESFGWPSCVSVVTPWLAAKERGRVMGVWGSCQAVGAMLANWIVSWLMDKAGWRMSFWGVVAIVGAVGLWVLLALLAHPNRGGLVSPQQWVAGMRPHDLASGRHTTVDGEVLWEETLPGGTSEKEERKAQELTTTQLAKLPSVLDLAGSYFCQKLVRYSLTSWLPYYMVKELAYTPTQAGYLSSSFDLGGVIGSVASGVFSDWYAGGRRRVGACGIYLQAGAVSLLLFSFLKPVMMHSTALTAVLSGAIGFFFFGCDTLMTGATLQDLSERLKVPEHAGSISGFVGGIGSIGAILQGPVTAKIAEWYGWESVFYFLMLLAFTAFAFMLRPIMLERHASGPTD